MGSAYTSEQGTLIDACYEAAIDEAVAAGIPVSETMVSKIANCLILASNAGETDAERLKGWALNALDASRFPAPPILPLISERD